MKELLSESDLEVVLKNFEEKSKFLVTVLERKFKNNLWNFKKIYLFYFRKLYRVVEKITSRKFSRFSREIFKNI